MSTDMSTGTTTGTTTGMTTDEVPSRARLGRLALVGAAAVLVVAPIMAGLVLAWQVHPLWVVPAYLVGIPAWLTLLSGAWSLVGRLRPTRDEPLGAAAPADGTGSAGEQLPAVRTELRLPPPRTEVPSTARTEVRTLATGAAPRVLRTPTP